MNQRYFFFSQTILKDSWHGRDRIRASKTTIRIQTDPLTSNNSNLVSGWGRTHRQSWFSGLAEGSCTLHQSARLASIRKKDSATPRINNNNNDNNNNAVFRRNRVWHRPRCYLDSLDASRNRSNNASRMKTEISWQSTRSKEHGFEKYILGRGISRALLPMSETTKTEPALLSFLNVFFVSSKLMLTC